MSVSYSIPRRTRSVPLFHLPTALNQKIAEAEHDQLYTTVTTVHTRGTWASSQTPSTQFASTHAVTNHPDNTCLSDCHIVRGAEGARENSESSPLGHGKQFPLVQFTTVQTSEKSSKRSSRASSTFRALAVPRRTSSKIQQLLQTSLYGSERTHRTALQQQQEQQQRSCQLFSSLDSTLALSQSRSTSALSQPLDTEKCSDSDTQKAPLSLFEIPCDAGIGHRPAAPTTPPRATSAASHRSNTSYYSLFPRSCPTPPPQRMPHLLPSSRESESTRERKASTTSSSVVSSNLKVEINHRPGAKQGTGGFRSIWRSMMSLRSRKSVSGTCEAGTLRTRGRVHDKRPIVVDNYLCGNGAGAEYRPRSSWSCLAF